MKMDIKNSSPRLFMGSNDDDGDQDRCYNQPFGSHNPQVFSSAEALFSPICDDRAGCFGERLHQAELQIDDQYYALRRRGLSSCHEIKNEVEINGLEYLWKKVDRGAPMVEPEMTINPVKWMSTKMRLMHKIKNPSDHGSRTLVIKNPSHRSSTDQHELVEDHKPHRSSYPGTGLSKDHSSYNSNPIRVCSDCNTTKTPLWRSGPKGPKSLCNACGIRQRKARRAMAAALASASGAVATTGQPLAAKFKVQHKEKAAGTNGNASQLKKRCKMNAVVVATADGSQSSRKREPGFEDFLIKLSQKIAFHRVFPQDEKDAAILLMALSSGLVHG